jgi:hypothetical protein
MVGFSSHARSLLISPLKPFLADEDAMYEDEAYDEELDYGDEMSQDEEENPSDEEDEMLDEMGDIEGLPGEPGVVEVIMGENEDDDEDLDEDEDEDVDEDEEDEDDEDEEDEDEDMEEMEDRIEIVDEEGHPMEDDGASGWESETDEEDEDVDEEHQFDEQVQDMHDALMHNHGLDQLGRIPDILRDVVDGEEDLEGDDPHDIDGGYIDDGGEDEGEWPIELHSTVGNQANAAGDEEEEDEGDEDEAYYDHPHHHRKYFFYLTVLIYLVVPHALVKSDVFQMTTMPLPCLHQASAGTSLKSSPITASGMEVRGARSPLVRFWEATSVILWDPVRSLTTAAANKVGTRDIHWKNWSSPHAV